MPFGGFEYALATWRMPRSGQSEPMSERTRIRHDRPVPVTRTFSADRLRGRRHASLSHRPIEGNRGDAHGFPMLMTLLANDSHRWPERLWIVRHGESAGNVARDTAQANGATRIRLDQRDVDVPLSPRGRDQAAALGRWFADRDAADRPEVLLASPYVRAHQTAELFRQFGGASDVPICLDERLREKEFGILDGLTTQGVATLFPDQAELRQLLGKFYHRPPGGESWCDVVFRLRAVLDTIALHYAGRRVMIVAHQVVVLCLRYVIENLTEEEILTIDRAGDVANCAVTDYRFDPSPSSGGRLRLLDYNMTAPVEEDPVAEVTAEPAAPKGVGG